MPTKCIQKGSLHYTEIITTTTEIFHILMKDTNPIMVQSLLEIFASFITHSRHEDIVHNLVQNNKTLQLLLSNYLQKEIGNIGTLSLEEYYKSQEKYTFFHKCQKILETTQAVQLVRNII